YVVAGLAHFVRTDYYLPMMPAYLPAHRELVLLSGVAEVVLGIAVLIPQTRRLAAWGVILLLIAIFPANLHIALHNVPLFGAAQRADIWNWVRLPFQLGLIAWAWWCGGLTRDSVSGQNGERAWDSMKSASVVPRPAQPARHAPEREAGR